MEKAIFTFSIYEQKVANQWEIIACIWSDNKSILSHKVYLTRKKSGSFGLLLSFLHSSYHKLEIRQSPHYVFDIFSHKFVVIKYSFYIKTPQATVSFGIWDGNIFFAIIIWNIIFLEGN